MASSAPASGANSAAQRRRVVRICRLPWPICTAMRASARSGRTIVCSPPTQTPSSTNAPISANWM